MHKIDKFLKRQDKDDKEKIIKILKLINSGDFIRLDLKKLRGNNDLYRVRVGKFRIIFIVDKKEIIIVDISKRREDTYDNI